MKKINPFIFRAFDIRGKYPKELSEEIAFKITKAFLTLFPKIKKIVVSRDPRLSSPPLFKAIKKAILEEGKELVNIGIAPDSLFFFSIFKEKADGGIMISGSHNEKEYNGFCLCKRKGKEIRELIKEDLERIKEIVIKEKFSRKEKKKKGRYLKKSYLKEYIDFVTKKVSFKRPLKIIIDSGNGSCNFIPEKIFKKLNCKVKTLYGKFDGHFPHHLPNPYEEKNLKDIKKAVIEEKADIGFAFDSDGDRVAPIDNKGRIVSGDDCLLMLAREEIRKKKGPIVHCMRAPLSFLEEMRKKRIKTFFSVSHHAAIIKKIREKKAIFGGEITYHFLFPEDYYLVDDAIFASLKIAEIASKYYPFSEYIDSLPRYFSSKEYFIKVKEEEKFEIIRRIKKVLRKKGIKFIAVDGARINYKNGWALFRASNTESLIKLRFEGKTKKDLLKIKEKAFNLLREAKVKVSKREIGI